MRPGMTDPITATVGVITSLSSALDILKGMQSLNTQADINLATIQLHKFILDQNDRLTSYSAKLLELQDNALKQQNEIVNLKKELESRVSYTLVEIGNGFRAYVRNEVSSDAVNDPKREKLTYFCQRCYDAEGKVIALQPAFFSGLYGGVDSQSIECLSCKTIFRFGYTKA